MGVVSRVLEHFSAQRALCPVGCLESFLTPNESLFLHSFAIFGPHYCQGQMLRLALFAALSFGRKMQQSEELLGVKDAETSHPKVTLKPSDVALGPI